MNQQQKVEIGLRIKQLRDDSAETNRSIAAYCEVSTEAVRNWVAGKGILYDNAEKVAELFKVDIDWLWRGREKDVTPDPLNVPILTTADIERLKRIEEEQREQRKQLDEILRRLTPPDEDQPGEEDGGLPSKLPDGPDRPPNDEEPDDLEEQTG